MRAIVAAALSSFAVLAPSDHASATFRSGTLALTLRYPMTCGLPGRGPVAVTLPRGFRIVSLRAALGGKPAPASHSGRTVDVTLPKPPHVTCMSISEGTLRVTLAGLHAGSGTYAVTAQVNRRSFRTSFRVS